MKSREERRQDNDRIRVRILDRLRAENEHELAAKLARCQQDYPLFCENCGRNVMGRTKCRRKWCPCCAPGIAGDRNRRMRAAVERFKWPLFITLTVRNVDDLNHGAVRKLRRCFGKLRMQKWWKSSVTGGIACIEVTNIGNGWHPHLHAVLDARWLSDNVLEPRPDWSRQEKRKAFQQATTSIETRWAKLVGQDSVSIKVKRCSSSTITKEVVKYSVKGTDLATCPDHIGPLIRALDTCRLMTTFGKAYRLGKIKRTSEAYERQFSEETGELLPAPTLCGCHTPALIPPAISEIATPRKSPGCVRDRSGVWHAPGDNKRLALALVAQGTSQPIRQTSDHASTKPPYGLGATRAS